MATLLRRLFDAALRHRVAVCLSLGLLLLLPGLSAGFYLDDLWQQSLLDAHERGLDDRGGMELALGLWSWDTGLTERTYLRTGAPYMATWFSDLDLSVRFFRPLSAWTLMIDHRFGGSNPFIYHVVNLAFWLLFAAAALELHRRLLPAPGARPALLLAGLFFVLSDTHYNNVAWISSRHALLASLLSLVCILFYDRFRHRGGLRNLALSVVALALGLAAGETAVLTLAWIAAYELFLSHDPPRLRIACAAPLFALAAGFVVFYVSAGYGAHGSSWYVNPLDRPLEFLRVAFTERLPGYLMGALTLMPSEIFQADSVPVNLVGLALLAAVVLTLLPSLLWRPEMRFAAAATLLSILFLCTAPPFSNKLMLPSAAVSLLLAVGVTDGLRRLAKGGVAGRLRRAALYAGVGLILLMQGIGAPALGSYLLRDFVRVSSPETRYALWRTIEWPVEREEAEVYLLNTPGSWTGLFLPYEDFLFTRRWVGNYVTVSFESVDFEMTRLDANTVRLRSEVGFLAGYFPQWLAALVRANPGLRAGEDFIRDELTVVVDQARSGVPTVLLVRFPADLDDPNVHLLAYDGTRTRRIRPPAIGETAWVRVARP